MVMSKLLNFVADNVFSRYVSTFDIENSHGEVYLRRWYLSRCNERAPKAVAALLDFVKKKLGIEFYLHNILLSDDARHLHDHPWNFASIVLSGKYKQAVMDADKKRYREEEFEAIGVNYMDCNTFHRVIIGPNEQKLKNTWTLVVRSNNEKPWGFLLENNEWEDQVTYLNKKFGVGGWSRDHHSYDELGYVTTRDKDEYGGAQRHDVEAP